MDFGLSEEHQMVQRMVRDFAAKEVLPTIQEQDRVGGMAPFIIPRMAELGILGITIPVKYGGQGMDYISLGLVSEELEFIDTSLRVVISVHNGLTCLTLLQCRRTMADLSPVLSVLHMSQSSMGLKMQF